MQVIGYNLTGKFDFLNEDLAVIVEKFCPQLIFSFNIFKTKDCTATGA